MDWTVGSFVAKCCEMVVAGQTRGILDDDFIYTKNHHLYIEGLTLGQTLGVTLPIGLCHGLTPGVIRRLILMIVWWIWSTSL